MHSETDVLDCYRHMLRQMLDMVNYARDGEWETLVAVQREYVAGVDQLAISEHTIALDATGRRYKQQLINQIREAEAIVRERLAVRMDELSGLMKKAHQNRKVQRAYVDTVAV